MKQLINIQQALKAPKGQYNSFGKYKYRSCEDILEAVKPLLGENNVTLTITDDIVNVGDRYYIKATAILKSDIESISVCALAREEETKKGMDGSQITGTASSYARKYALNGLFCIDDTKDADTQPPVKETKPTEQPPIKETTEEEDLYKVNLIGRIQGCKKIEDVVKLWNENPNYTSFSDVKEAFSKRKLEVQ